MSSVRVPSPGTPFLCALSGLLFAACGVSTAHPAVADLDHSGEGGAYSAGGAVDDGPPVQGDSAPVGAHDAGQTGMTDAFGTPSDPSGAPPGTLLGSSPPTPGCTAKHDPTQIYLFGILEGASLGPNGRSAMGTAPLSAPQEVCATMVPSAGYVILRPYDGAVIAPYLSTVQLFQPQPYAQDAVTTLWGPDFAAASSMNVMLAPPPAGCAEPATYVDPASRFFFQCGGTGGAIPAYAVIDTTGKVVSTRYAQMLHVGHGGIKLMGGSSPGIVDAYERYTPLSDGAFFGGPITVRAVADGFIAAQLQGGQGSGLRELFHIDTKGKSKLLGTFVPGETNCMSSDNCSWALDPAMNLYESHDGTGNVYKIALGGAATVVYSPTTVAPSDWSTTPPKVRLKLPQVFTGP